MSKGPGKEYHLQVDVDRATKCVSVSYLDRKCAAQFIGDHQGSVLVREDCPILLPPSLVETKLPAADLLPWPMGDGVDREAYPANLNMDLIQRAVAAAYANAEDRTSAVVITYRGRIIAEQYAQGVSKDTQLESWSMGKTLLATLYSLCENDGTYHRSQYAPVPEWAGDKRSEIRIEDLLRMSSPLQCSVRSNNYDWDQGCPDHELGYTEPIDVFEFARNQPLRPESDSAGSYRNVDPLVIGWLIKDALIRRGEDYLSFPQRALFDRIGIRRQVIETDPFGNFILTGCNYATARNWARLGMLYAQDGIWQGERILPLGWTEFVRTPAPAWNGRYGALVWLNKSGFFNELPESTYWAWGGGGQMMAIIPSHDLVVVRMGQAGWEMGDVDKQSTREMLALLMKAIPPSD